MNLWVKTTLDGRGVAFGGIPLHQLNEMLFHIRIRNAVLL